MPPWSRPTSVSAVTLRKSSLRLFIAPCACHSPGRSPVTQPSATPMSLVRVSIVSEDRRLDVGVPGSIPLVEVIPGFARSLGVLDPTLVHGGYALRRADGGELDPS